MVHTMKATGPVCLLAKKEERAGSLSHSSCSGPVLGPGHSVHLCYGLKGKVCYRSTLSLLGMDLHHTFLTASWEGVGELLASIQLIYGRM